MSFASLQSSSASAEAISLAAQCPSLVSKVLESSELSVASYPLSVRTFVDCLQSERKVVSKLLLTCFEVFTDTSPASAVARATGGVFGHQFNLATILLPGGHSTHVRVDYYAAPPHGADSRLVVSLSDSHAALAAGGHLLSRVAAPSASVCASPPTLSALASLLAIADKRLAVRPYSVLGYNCFWMTDMLYNTLARRYAEHWLAVGGLTPDAPLRRFLRGEAGALQTAIACATPDETARRWAQLAGNVVRGIQVVLTQHSGPGRFVMHDAEVAEWAREWNKAEKAAASK